MVDGCGHRPDCDGCPRFEADPEKVYAEKIAAVAALAGVYDLYAWPAPSAVAQGPTLAYRNRARMLVTDDGKLGFYRAGSRDAHPIETCVVHEPAVEAALNRVRERVDLRDVRYVDVRANDSGEAIITFGLEVRPDDAWLAELGAISDEKTAVHINVGTKQAILGGRQECLRGAQSLTMRAGGREYDVPPAAFFQINTRVLEQIHEAICPWIQSEALLWDLYCGVGVHGIACARKGRHIRGIDIEASALRAAAANAERHGVPATYLERSDADVELDSEPANAVLNPSRSGLACDLPAKLGRSGVRRIAYVSCEPMTFFRDAERLENEGFGLSRLSAFDMMPRTDHIELAGLFERHERPRRWEDLGFGVTGAAANGDNDVWVALIVGNVAKRATLPGGLVSVEKIRSVEDASVVRLTAPRALEPEMLRATLRRWSFPVVGDTRYGRKSSNFRWSRDFAVDAPILHRVRSGKHTAAIPAFLLSLLKIPRKLADQAAR